MSTTQKVQEIRATLRQRLAEFVARFQIDMIIVENALSIPMNIPLGVALTHFIAQELSAMNAHNRWSCRLHGVDNRGATG